MILVGRSVSFLTSFCAFQSSTLATLTTSNNNMLEKGLHPMSRFGRRTAIAGSAAPSFSNDVSVEDIETWTKQIKDSFLTSVAKIEESSDGTWDDTVGAFSLALGESAEASAMVTLPSMTHADASVRKASTQSKDELKLLFDEVFARPNLYHALCRTSPSSEDAYFDGLLKQQFRRNGSHLENDSSRKVLLQKRQELEKICSEFTTSINEHSDDTLEFTEEELHGVDFSNFPVANDDNGSNKRIITLKAPFVKPIMQFATNSKTRQKVSIAMAKKCQEDNTSHFLNALRLRQECADILGYPSHAHYMLQSKMASNPERAESFLLDLIDKIKPQSRKNISILETLKQEEGDNDGEGLQVWDTSYYQRVYKAKTLGVDEAKLKTYFPLKHVQHQILSMYEELLNLKFSKLQDAEVWHPDVECYSVSPAGSDKESDILGYFYFDIFPRKGKYSHQCVYPLRPSYYHQDSKHIVKPACVNIGNLNPTKDGKPSLLLFSEVVTFFHEFGHVMHCVLSQSKHSLQAWAWSAVPWPGGVEQDFLEVPSMMLENFVWQPDILRRLSHHIEDGSSLSEEDITALSKSRFVMEGYNRSRYLAMALYDLKVHSPTNNDGLYEYNGESYDAISLYDAMMTDISGISQIPESFPVASWFHPMMGYDAGYYSYIWSETYAADLFGEFEKLQGTSIIDPSLGKKYKECILNPCAMIDGNSMLRSFLGREPSNQAFLNRMMSS